MRARIPYAHRPFIGAMSPDVERGTGEGGNLSDLRADSEARLPAVNHPRLFGKPLAPSALRKRHRIGVPLFATSPPFRVTRLQGNLRAIRALWYPA